MNLVCDNDDLKESVEDYKNENAKLRETCNLQKDQIAMLQRKMTRLNEVDR